MNTTGKWLTKTLGAKWFLIEEVKQKIRHRDQEELVFLLILSNINYPLKPKQNDNNLHNMRIPKMLTVFIRFSV